MIGEKGVSLIESLLVIVVVGVIVALMANLPNAMGLITKSKQLSLAREIAAKQLEDKRATSYINLADGSEDLKTLDSRLSLLPFGEGTVIVEDCDLEKICINGENIKKVTVNIKWKNNNKQQTVLVNTLIGEGGLNQ